MLLLLLLWQLLLLLWLLFVKADHSHDVFEIRSRPRSTKKKNPLLMLRRLSNLNSASRVLNEMEKPGKEK